jgi:hypothetical protein
LLTERLERIGDIAGDLSRELARNCGDCAAMRAMAEQLRDDAEAVLRELKPVAARILSPSSRVV